jgi:hypothetical protein
MIGISYGAISQLFTAQLDPPASRRSRRSRRSTHWRRRCTPAASSTPASRSPGPSSASRTRSRPARTAARRGLYADRRRRPDLRGQPGPARRGGRPAGRDQRCQRVLQPQVADPLDPVTFVNKINGADVHGLPVGRRADRRTLRRSGPALHRHESEVVHVHERRPHRLARSVHVRPLVRLLRAVRRPPGADRPRGVDPSGRAGHLPEAMGSTTRIRHAAPRPDPDSIPTYQAALAAFEKLPRSGCCSTTVPGPRRNRTNRPPAIRTRASSSRSRRSRSLGRPRKLLVPRPGRHAHQPAAVGRASTPTPPTPTRSR